jgi:ABC-type transporter MlaC component
MKRKSFLKPGCCVLVLVAVLFISCAGRASAQREDPGAFLEKMFAEGSQELQKHKTQEERISFVQEFISKVLNIQGIGIRALGSLAKKISPEQKIEFDARFIQYFLKCNRIISELAKSSEIAFECDRHKKNIKGDTAQVSGKMYLSGKSYEAWFGTEWDKERTIWVVQNTSAENLDSVVSTYRSEFNDFVNCYNPGKVINEYLDCRLRGGSEAECKKGRFSVVRGDN